MADIHALITKLRRPPSLPNWVRYNHRRLDDTTNGMARFILGKPRFSIHKVYGILADVVTFGLSDEAAYKSLSLIKNPKVQKLGREILDAILPYIRKSELRGIQVFHDLVTLYQVGRGVSVPVKPTFVLLRDGRLIPVFVIGWASVPFTDFQKRLLSTVIRDAILTLEGFEGSDAEIICVPRVGKHERAVRSWKVSDYDCLPDDEKREQLDRYGLALDKVVPIILEELSRRGEL